MPVDNPVQLINDHLLPTFLLEQTGNGHRVGLKKIDEYYRGIQDDPIKPMDPTTRQYARLMARAKFNILDLVVKVRAQALILNSFRSNDPDATNAKCWQYWQDNRWDARQAQVWSTALTYGVAYSTVLPGANVFTRKPGPVITAHSPRHFMAFYEDPANDEFPECAIEVHGLTKECKLPDWQGEQKATITLIDDTYAIDYIQGDSEGVWDETSRIEHGVPVCPVIRFVNELDLDGRYWGEVEPLIPSQDNLNQTLFDLLMTQTFNSFKIRWISGVMLGDVDEDGNPVPGNKAQQEKMRLAQDVMMVFPDADTKAGTMEETSMGPFIDSALFAIRRFAIKSQTPPQNFLGDIGGNIASDALSALESAASRKTAERQKSFGEAVGQMLRVAAYMGGDLDEAKDYTLETFWEDTETRSLAQVADAYGKMAVMLEVPPDQLWERIPDVTQEDVQRWRNAKKKRDAEALAQQMALQPPEGGVNGQSGANRGAGSLVRPTASQLGSAYGSSNGANVAGSGVSGSRSVVG